MQFCIARHLSNHPLKCNCIFSVFLGHRYQLDLSFWWDWFLGTPSWWCLSPPDKLVSVAMKISNEPPLCLLIVSIFNICFHHVKMLEIIFKMSGRWTQWLNVWGKYEKTKTRGQILGRAKIMQWNRWKSSCDRNMAVKLAIFNGFDKFFFPPVKKW